VWGGRSSLFVVLQTDKASMLDEIIDYVRFLQLQVKVMPFSWQFMSLIQCDRVPVQYVLTLVVLCIALAHRFSA
jgi:hypothetical protein